MTSGEVITITLTMYVEPWAPEGTATNTARVSSDSEDDDEENNEDTEDIVIPPVTAVVLTSFETDNKIGDNVLVQWATQTETDVFGFKLYHSIRDEFASAEEIHYQSATGGDGGQFYEFEDPVHANGMHYYWITFLSTSGFESDPQAQDTVLVDWFQSVFVPVMK
jgi:hypothetical protein